MTTKPRLPSSAPSDAADRRSETEQQQQQIPPETAAAAAAATADHGDGDDDRMPAAYYDYPPGYFGGYYGPPPPPFYTGYPPPYYYGMSYAALPPPPPSQQAPPPPQPPVVAPPSKQKKTTTAATTKAPPTPATRRSSRRSGKEQASPEPSKLASKAAGKGEKDDAKMTAAATTSAPAPAAAEIPLLELGPDFLVGKPIRLFDPTMDHYHTGRIVDYREHDDDDDDTEYLVRFCAGADGRKTSFDHWIFLEEHDLSVGTTVVWAHSQNQWQPCLVWLRTARSIVLQDFVDVLAIRNRVKAASRGGAPNKPEPAVVVSKALTTGKKESADTIGSAPPGDETAAAARGETSRAHYCRRKNTSTTTEKVEEPAASPKKRNKKKFEYHVADLVLETASRRDKISAWVKPFDPKLCYANIDVKLYAVDYMTPQAYQSYCQSKRLKLLSWMAMAEWQEQVKVHKWRTGLQTINRFGPRALTSRDEYHLEPLIPALVEDDDNHSTTKSEDFTPNAQLTPLVQQGVDRLYLLDLLQRQHGIAPTRDLGASLSCRIVGISDCTTTTTTTSPRGTTNNGELTKSPNRMIIEDEEESKDIKQDQAEEDKNNSSKP